MRENFSAPWRCPVCGEIIAVDGYGDIERAGEVIGALSRHVESVHDAPDRQMADALMDAQLTLIHEAITADLDQTIAEVRRGLVDEPNVMFLMTSLGQAIHAQRPYGTILALLTAALIRLAQTEEPPRKEGAR